MRFADRAANREPEPQTARLGRVEWLEDMLSGPRRKSRTRISHCDEHATGLRFFRADQQVPRTVAGFAHRLDRVDDQVQDYLLQLHPISCNERQVLRGLHVHRDTVLHGFAAGELNHLADCSADLQAILPRRRLHYEVANPVDDLARPLAIVDDTSERLPRLFQIRRLTIQPAPRRAGVTDARRDGLFHFMGDPGRELPYSGDAAGVRQLSPCLATTTRTVAFLQHRLLR